MAHINGPANGHGTITGTSGNDLIVAYGDANTITGGGGDDTISAVSGNDNSISVGTLSDGLSSLTDIIRIDGLGDTVAGGDENVRLAGEVSDTSVTLGRGADTVSLIGASNTLSFGGGNDVIRALGGNDTILLTGSVYPTYADSIRVSGAHNSVTNKLSGGAQPALGTLTIQGGSGSGTFVLGTTGGTIATSGVDNFIEGGFAPTKIVAGSGYDTVSLQPGARDVGGAATVLLGGTHNVVTRTIGDATITGGHGYDTVNLSAAASPSAFQVTDSGVYDSITLDVASGATIDGGSSFETVTLISSVANVTFAGQGDLLTLGGDAINAGYPTTSVTDLSRGLQVHLEQASQLDGFPSVGNLTINDFDPSGVITFEGGRGGFTSAAQAFADLQDNGNNDYSLVLPDGTGTISFLNDSHLTVANFHVG